MLDVETTPAKEDPTADYPVLFPQQQKVFVALGACTHPGLVRDRNEDQYLIAKLAKSMRICRSSLPEPELTRYSDEEGFVLIVADGMGGAAGGREASTLAVRTVESFVLDAVKWFLHHEGQEQNALTTELRHALERADRTIVERADSEPRLRGMGTTLTVGYSVGTDLFLAHAGDSRAYLLNPRRGRLERVTSDHTLVQLLVDGGFLSAEEARDHPRRNVVTNVVGGPSPGVHVELHRRELSDGDILLLCSDGLTEEVPEPEIARILGETSDPESAARKLIDAALAGGGSDNITAVVARYTMASA